MTDIAATGAQPGESSPAPDGKLLEVRNLKVHFPIEEGIIFKRKVGAVRAVDGIDLEILQARTLGLVGESGCGKSTTARAIAQLIPSNEGEVLMGGVDLIKAGKRALLDARMNIQMVFQDPYGSLNPRMTAGDIIAEPLRIFVNRKLLEMTSLDVREHVDSLMEKVGLSPTFRNRYPHEFSGGQRQRIG
ncbi:MAG: ATP-binding cassette domain-containing protein, partial [Spirochaetia bacterium]